MAKRFIDADDFLDLFYVASMGQDKAFVKTVEQVVEDTPTADVVEVKHGYWIYDVENGCFICSECKMSALNNYRGLSVDSENCPHCGAKMDGRTAIK